MAQQTTPFHPVGPQLTYFPDRKVLSSLQSASVSCPSVTAASGSVAGGVLPTLCIGIASAVERGFRRIQRRHS